MKKSFFNIFVLSASCLFVAGQEWVTDFEFAKEKAVVDNKHLLVQFTGSDWCQPCIQLKKNVLDKDEFKVRASKKFVLVELDYPYDKKAQSDELQAQNEKLKEVYNIKEYPTIYLINTDGRPYAALGFRADGPSEYYPEIDEGVANFEGYQSAIKEASKLEGMDKAKGYVKALNFIPDSLKLYYQTDINVITQNDPKDTTGFKASFNFYNEFELLKKKIKSAERGNNIEETLAEIDIFMNNNNISAESRQELKISKLSVDVARDMRAKNTRQALEKVDTYLKTENLDIVGKQQVMEIKLSAYLKAGSFSKAEMMIEEIINLDPESAYAKDLKEFKPYITKMRQQKAESKKGR